MKIKKWQIAIGVILLSASQGFRFITNLDKYINSYKTSKTFTDIFEGLFLDIVGGFLSIFRSVFHFLLTWQGVLLIAVILIHINFRYYLKNKKN